MANFPEYAHRYQAVRACPTAGYGPTARIKVDANLHYLKGNSRPYFSVTADISLPKRSDCESCGCMHDDVLKYFPQLALVVALHLSDDRGIPMHLEANGLFHLGFGKYSTLNLQYAADHFRITVAEAQAVRDHLASGSGYDETKYLIFIAQQKPRYHVEADAAIALLDSLIAKQESANASV